jgi:drug/metabolite transporter (DMT)-like permease
VRLAVLAACWGSSFLWIKLALRGLSPVQVVAARLVVGALILTAVVRGRGLRLPRGAGVWGLLLGAAFLSNAVPFLFFALGEQRVDSSLAGVLNGTTPLWTLAVGLAVRHERRVGLARAVGLVLGFAGVLLIFAPWEGAGAVDLWGTAACLTAALSYGFGYVYMDRFLAGRGLPALVLAASQLVAATALFAVVTPVAGLQRPDLRVDALVSAALLGILSTGAAFVLNYRLITDEGATATSTVAYLLPVVSVVLGALALGEPLTAHVLLGMAVVLVGVALARRGQGRVAATVTAARPGSPDSRGPSAPTA